MLIGLVNKHLLLNGRLYIVLPPPRPVHAYFTDVHRGCRFRCTSIFPAFDNYALC